MTFSYPPLPITKIIHLRTKSKFRNWAKIRHLEQWIKKHVPNLVNERLKSLSLMTLPCPSRYQKVNTRFDRTLITGNFNLDKTGMNHKYSGI